MHIRTLLACAIAALLTACANEPNLISQNSVVIPATSPSGIVIVVDGNVFGAPFFGTEGPAYMKGLASGLQSTLGGVPTRVVEVDAMTLNHPVLAALRDLHPSHTIRLLTISNLQRNGTPISAVWQMVVSQVAISPLAPQADHPVGTRYKVKQIYKARASGDACLDSDNEASKCGIAMGELFGKTLRAAHILQLDGGTI